MPHMPAPITGLGALEVGSPGLAEAHLGAERRAGLLQCSLAGERLVAPRAVSWKIRGG